MKYPESHKEHDDSDVQFTQFVEHFRHDDDCESKKNRYWQE